MSEGIDSKPARRGLSAMERDTLRRYLRTWSPRYDPAKIEVPPAVEGLLARYSALAEAGAHPPHTPPTPPTDSEAN